MSEHMVWEYDLAADGTGTGRDLLERLRDTRKRQEEYPWRRIARFDSYNDAEHVLRLVRRGLGAEEADTP